MEYIQCPHCQKKYGVNEKVRAASGKNIRCKACQESFEITIFSTPAAPVESDVSEVISSEKKPSEKTEAEVAAKSETSEITDETETSSKNEPETKNVLQIALTAVLALVLIAGLIVAYQLSQSPQSPKAEAPKRVDPFTRPVVREPVIAPATSQSGTDRKEDQGGADTTAGIPKPEQDNGSELARELKEATAITEPETSEKALPEPLPVTEAPAAQLKPTESPASEPSATAVQPQEEKAPLTTVNKTIDDAPDNPSDDCKLAATDQWFIDYMITHGTLSGTEYVRMLDESSGKTEEVRNACKSKYLASKIADAARQGIKPEWIRAEIDARASSIYGKKSKDDGKW